MITSNQGRYLRCFHRVINFHTLVAMASLAYGGFVGLDPAPPPCVSCPRYRLCCNGLTLAYRAGKEDGAKRKPKKKKKISSRGLLYDSTMRSYQQ